MKMKTNKEIADFYDEYVERQQTIWHNERHYFLLDELKKAGMQSGTTVLELGCGIGTMTNLIAPVIKPGKLVASDISPKSVEAARTNNKQHTNIEYITADSTSHVFPDLTYDFVVLLDVMEHIQEPYRADIVRLIAERMSENTKFIMNVPAPHAHIHAIEHFPDAMQLVEVPVFLKDMVPMFEAHGLEIVRFFTYDMWQNDEYQYYEIRKKSPYVFRKTEPAAALNPYSLARRIKRKLGR